MKAPLVVRKLAENRALGSMVKRGGSLYCVNDRPPTETARGVGVTTAGVEVSKAWRVGSAAEVAIGALVAPTAAVVGCQPLCLQQRGLGSL